ncbi:IS110 family transposase [Mycolicibacter virginiensis]|uniref:IS110 family transposase n=1 Tax=Mycolicibacter virginiensis TaxID=1795032 RepID=A0A9X7IM11_9MYCO|nr:IS110 family transposase [Mycolicibacter virginiensis]PQM51541.1 IS110 family transposase [Mycolicibacter virginiensis]ULP47405.1 IS110 family transposase [Mycolicibacter virginiensis]
MEVIHPRCAGIDVSKRDAKVCVRIQGRGRKATSSTVTTWTSMTASIMALREHLIAEKVTCVVIESTAAYWKPFYFLLDDVLNVMLVNARHARNVPGRKTDVSDAAWLAELGAHGLVRASFVPPEPIRALRDLTRARTTIAQARTKEIGRLETLLEDTGIKLSTVACEIIGVSGRLMLEALIAGQRDPAVLADLAKGQLRKKIPALTEALAGRFNGHHAFMVRFYLDRIDAHDADIARLDARIEELIVPFQAVRELLVSIPGFSYTVANVFIAETGADMSVFPTANHLASWAGVASGSNESAGRVKSAKTPPGNHHLKAALGVAALSASRSANTYFGIRYRRIAGSRPSRSGTTKSRRQSLAGQIAIVAIEHKMLTCAWHMIVNGTFYQDPGPDYYTRHQPAKAKARAIKQLQALGYSVTLQPRTDAA